MRRPSLFWRAMGHIERRLPAFPAYDPAADRRVTVWQRMALLPAFMTPLVVLVMRTRSGDVRAAWSFWRPLLLDVALVVAAAGVVAAVMAGIVGWRKAKAGLHA